MTMVDKLDPKLKENPMAPSQVLNQVKSEAAQKLGINPNEVRHLVNYEYNTQKLNFEIDRNLYWILHEAVMLGICRSNTLNAIGGVVTC